MQLLGQIKNTQGIDDIDVIAAEQELRYKNIIVGDKNLSRQLVSFQANKQRPVYRWYKFKEGFSKTEGVFLWLTITLNTQVLASP